MVSKTSLEQIDSTFVAIAFFLVLHLTSYAEHTLRIKHRSGANTKRHLQSHLNHIERPKPGKTSRWRSNRPMSNF